MNIKFADEHTFDRFHECSMKTAQMENSLGKCIIRLAQWHPWNHDCIISCDFDELSFFFQEKTPDGKTGMCGGIIFHGKRDNGGDGSGPTFSVSLDPTDGYAIHT